MRQLLLIIFFVFLDRSSKYMAINDLLPSWGGLFDYACNQQIAWNLPLSGILFWIIWLPVIFFVVYYYLNNKRPTTLGLVIAGALSNAVDRLIYGCVVDFIDLGSFPTFNVADAMITGGMAFYVWSMLRHTTKNDRR